MNNLIPIIGGGTSSDLIKKKMVNAILRHTVEKADGSKEIFERTLEASDEKFMQGDQWLWNPAKPDRDADDTHFREDKSWVIQKEKHIIEDAQGNRTIDEKAVKTEDYWSSHGAKLIENAPAHETDKRILLLNDFSIGKDPFGLLGTDKKELFLEGDK